MKRKVILTILLVCGLIGCSQKEVSVLEPAKEPEKWD